MLSLQGENCTAKKPSTNPLKSSTLHHTLEHREQSKNIDQWMNRDLNPGLVGVRFLESAVV